ncbi:tRNA (adenosine(37)-N6)-threonylcarbamoyltransferase complex dimerization subunit type 1 TsaB [Noviherbaspirillum sp.]|uniref:tRNA (adenosine(37)-N6)-threonylcarbamoyltransferase complex dimerization subunit type 1 TsaB n=1 Tax=Noviherbaspirillum sp. TaxID=1926288 RepID=UPI002D38CC5B|nr:tRNA (adenosine(37)-N6)-threonylcarbamoyltransferase complex dimerization subunit type 1 TsaB [Noviherbaspirillum sp.]HZW23442.1 tRNA (adenosine(37)-N6)-threonylcarbamoyltransferase complex dimerization subunit type 1 TsaB [Noviherbaspirillum sp.]
MPTILAIDTSSELASVALLHRGQLISNEAAGVQTHSQTILPMVQALLAQAGIPLTACGAIAFGAGPGSFTGVRTACGVAQGLAYGAGLPVVPVVTLLAMAAACRETSGAGEVLAVLDARMEEVYWAQYRYNEGWEIVAEPALSAPGAVVMQGDAAVCGNGLAAYASAFGNWKETWPHIMPHAAQIARLAETDLAAGRGVAPHEAQPIYLRNKVALTTAERQAKVAS